MEIILPDGSKKILEEGATVYDVAASIGTSLAKAALAGKINGELVDVTAQVTDGATIEIITNKSPEALSIMRHSCAHIMAEAVQELFPGAQIAFGQNGIHHHIRVQIPDYPSVRVGQDRDLPPRQCGFCAGRAVAAHCGDSLHFTAPRPHGLTKGRLPSHRRGVFQIGHCHGKAAPTEPPANAGGNVSGSSYQNQHFIWLSFNWVT